MEKKIENEEEKYDDLPRIIIETLEMIEEKYILDTAIKFKDELPPLSVKFNIK